ncbi:hypothetical protein ACMFMF_006275 [Clarireedia jacksonii]
MPIQKEIYKFELCKSRGVELHALITDFSSNEANKSCSMAENRLLKKSHEPNSYELGSLSARYENKRYAGLWARPKFLLLETVEDRLEYYRRFFIDEPLLRRVRGNDKSDEIRVRLDVLHLYFFLL